MNASMNVVEASGLGKRYGGTWALRECTLAVPAGHVAALVGPNGAGKTTLLNIAVGLVAPSAGAVSALGGLPPGSGEVEDLLATHRLLTGPAAAADRYAQRPVVHVRRGGAQAHLLVRATAGDPVPPGWQAHPVCLEELALAYLREPAAVALPGPARGRDTQPSQVRR